MRSTIVALVAVLLLAGAPAFAGGGEKGDWELGVYGGYGWLDDYGIFHPENSTLWGARLGYFLTSNWNLELSGQRLGTDTEYPDTLGLEDTDLRLDALRLNLLYNFGAGKSFRPFLTAGVGREFLDVEGVGDTGDFGWNLGLGFRAFLSPRWNLRADGRFVNTKVGEDVDENQQNIEATLGLGFVFGGGGGDVEEIRTEQPNQAPTVTCAADRAEILPGESVILRATASDPEGDPVTYAWSATSGRVTGTGPEATLDFTGMTPPASSTVTVRATDSRGNASSSDCTVRLLEPVRPAEAISCVAGGFPRNLSRLSNVDKACLDDVAQRMSGDPRARVIVIGHSDSRETTSGIAQRRADAVRDYLVKERSIEGTRIEVRSAAATKPLDTGTGSAALASNRRVEIWFVPEGAKVPE